MSIPKFGELGTAARVTIDDEEVARLLIASQPGGREILDRMDRRQLLNGDWLNIDDVDIDDEGRYLLTATHDTSDLQPHDVGVHLSGELAEPQGFVPVDHATVATPECVIAEDPAMEARDTVAIAELFQKSFMAFSMAAAAPHNRQVHSLALGAISYREPVVDWWTLRDQTLRSVKIVGLSGSPIRLGSTDQVVMGRTNYTVDAAPHSPLIVAEPGHMSPVNHVAARPHMDATRDMTATRIGFSSLRVNFWALVLCPCVLVAYVLSGLAWSPLFLFLIPVVIVAVGLFATAVANVAFYVANAGQGPPDTN